MSYNSACGYSGPGCCGRCSSSSLESMLSSYSSSAGYNSSQPSYQSTQSAYSGDISYMIASAQSSNFAGSFTSIMPYDFAGSRFNPYSSKEGMFPRTAITRTYYSNVDSWLSPNRQITSFIGDAAEIKDLVEEAFTAVTGMQFPDDIIIRILSKEDIVKSHSNLSRSRGEVQGFAINRKTLGMLSEIFIKKDELAKVMLTVGHELGHVLTKKLENAQDEEAKAFAFSVAWMRKIKELNIANLSTAIRLEQPAENGLHDRALDFVLKQTREGKEPYIIYLDLIKGTLQVN